MLLQDPMRIEARCPRRRLLAAATCLLALAVVLAGVGVSAEAQSTIIIITGDSVKHLEGPLTPPAPAAAPAAPRPQIAPTSPAAQKPLAAPDPYRARSALDSIWLDSTVVPGQVPAFSVQLQASKDAVDALKKALERLQAGPAREELDQVRKEIEKAIQMLSNRDARFAYRVIDSVTLSPDGKNMLMRVYGGKDSPARLGIRVEVPGPLVAEQLGLKQGQGLAIVQVYKNSAAEKAGLRANDILLELAGKPVASNPEELAKQVGGLKAGPVPAAVLRKGKREEIKGLTLPEATPMAVRFLNRLQATVKVPGVPPVPPPAGVTTTTRTRSVEQFTTRHHDGKLTITVTGALEGGKATRIFEIAVQEGNAPATKYSDVERVPQQHRDRVRRLIESIPGTQGS